MIFKRLSIILLVLLFVGCVPSTEKNIGYEDIPEEEYIIDEDIPEEYIVDEDKDSNIPIPETLVKDIQVEVTTNNRGLSPELYQNSIVPDYMPIFSPDAKDTLIGKTEEEIIKIFGNTLPTYVVNARDFPEGETYPHSLWIYSLSAEDPTGIYLVFSENASEKIVCEYSANEFNGILGKGNNLPFYTEGKLNSKPSNSLSLRYIYTQENASFETLESNSPMIKDALASPPALELNDLYDRHPKYTVEIQTKQNLFPDKKLLIYSIQGNEEAKYLHLLIEDPLFEGNVLSSWVSEKLTLKEYVDKLDGK
ncbi:hypothetical protein ACPWSR_05245 [Alloiococcus sp. CFN-8]|uniref:hypothetical protein n=1 Tax=Alloiococcus sp. CFN-8 TaxID=3416081 RepID=UPI003CF77681